MGLTDKDAGNRVAAVEPMLDKHRLRLLVRSCGSGRVAKAARRCATAVRVRSDQLVDGVGLRMDVRRIARAIVAQIVFDQMRRIWAGHDVRACRRHAEQGERKHGNQRRSHATDNAGQ